MPVSPKEVAAKSAATHRASRRHSIPTRNPIFLHASILRDLKFLAAFILPQLCVSSSRRSTVLTMGRPLRIIETLDTSTKSQRHIYCLTLRLQPALEVLVAEAAHDRGVSKSDWIRAAIRHALAVHKREKNDR